MEKRIGVFISENKVLTLATSVNDIPYCANCFYAFNDKEQTLVFLSDESTRHISEALINKTVSGTIQNGVTTVAKIQGIQFTAEFIVPTMDDKNNFYAIYYKRFPFAKAKPASIWGVKLNWVKMTDNTLGFGKKLIWER